MEAMPATLTLQQHQKMESMLNRIDTLEAMVTRTLSENRRLQTELVSFKRATTNSDVCEVGEEDCAAGAGVSSQDVLALDHESAQPRSPPVLILGTRRVKPASVTVAIDTEQASATARANRAIKFRDEEDNGKRQRPVNFLDIFTEGSHAHVHTADAGTKTAAALGAAERVTGVVKETIGTGEASRSSQRAFKLSDIWEVNPADLTRTRCIGRGACGTVWEGNWRRSNVAIKDLDTPAGVESGEEREEDGLMDHDREMLAAFRGEVAQLSCLRHPNILAFYGAVSQGDKLCMIVELMDRDVRGFLKTDASRVSLEARVRIGVGAMSGVLYLHSQLPQVVHRDIKPENLLLSHGDTVVKVCDLGLARNKHGAFLQTVHQGGTLSYVAPEVHKGSDIDEGCDMYAMAIVLWELVTLGVPYSDKPPQSIPGIVGWGAERPSMTAFAPEVLGQVKDAREAAALTSLGALIRQCWEQEPAQRLRTANAHHSLGTLLDSLTGSSPLESKSMAAHTAGAAEGGVVAGGCFSKGAPTTNIPAKSKGRAGVRRPPSPRARESGDI